MMNHLYINILLKTFYFVFIVFRSMYIMFYYSYVRNYYKIYKIFKYIKTVCYCYHKRCKYLLTLLVLKI